MVPLIWWTFDVIRHEAGEEGTRYRSFEPSHVIGQEELEEVPYEVVVRKGFRNICLS